MPTCTYQTAGTRCPETATHAVVGSGLAADWRVMEMPAPTPVETPDVNRLRERQREFCLRHAMQVAEARNTAQMVAQEARLERPRTKPVQHCAVCGERLQGLGIQMPDLGALCDDCHRTANDAQLDDPRTKPPTRRRRRRTAA